MSFKKGTLDKLSLISHVCVAVILCKLTSTIIERLLVLVCIGIISGIQRLCMYNSIAEEPEGKTDSKTD